MFPSDLIDGQKYRNSNWPGTVYTAEVKKNAMGVLLSAEMRITSVPGSNESSYLKSFEGELVQKPGAKSEGEDDNQDFWNKFSKLN